VVAGMGSHAGRAVHALVAMLSLSSAIETRPTHALVTDARQPLPTKEASFLNASLLPESVVAPLAASTAASTRTTPMERLQNFIAERPASPGTYKRPAALAPAVHSMDEIAEDCLSDAVFDSLLSMPSTLVEADSKAELMGVMIALLVIGLGLLVIGHLFEVTFLVVSVCSILFIGSFICLYIFAGAGGEIAILAEANACVWPFGVSIGLTVATGLVLAAIFWCMHTIRGLINFITGFTLGLLSMLVLFVIIETNTDWAMVLTTDRTGLYLYASLTAVAAIVAGVLAIFFLPLIHILLRCACGGFLVAVGINGLVESSTGTALPSWAFHVIFAVSGAVGATIQFCLQNRRKERQAEDEASSASSSPPLIKA